MPLPDSTPPKQNRRTPTQILLSNYAATLQLRTDIQQIKTRLDVLEPTVAQLMDLKNTIDLLIVWKEREMNG